MADHVALAVLAAGLDQLVVQNAEERPLKTTSELSSCAVSDRAARPWGAFFALAFRPFAAFAGFRGFAAFVAFLAWRLSAFFGLAFAAFASACYLAAFAASPSNAAIFMRNQIKSIRNEPARSAGAHSGELCIDPARRGILNRAEFSIDAAAAWHPYELWRAGIDPRSERVADRRLLSHYRGAGPDRLFLDYCAGRRRRGRSMPRCRSSEGWQSAPALPAHWPELVRLLAAQNPVAQPPRRRLQPCARAREPW